VFPRNDHAWAEAYRLRGVETEVGHFEIAEVERRLSELLEPDGGWRVIDVWASEDAANAFYRSDQFKPVVAGSENMGISSKPWPMHRLEVDQTLKHGS
jgi:hypothetical protein